MSMLADLWHKTMGNWDEFEQERRDAYRQEAREDEAEENACPCCGKQLTHSRFTDEGIVVETVASCTCGYEVGTSYGNVFEDLPDGWYENDQGDIVNEDDEIILEGER